LREKQAMKCSNGNFFMGKWYVIRNMVISHLNRFCFWFVNIINVILIGEKINCEKLIKIIRNLFISESKNFVVPVRSDETTKMPKRKTCFLKFWRLPEGLFKIKVQIKLILIRN